MADALFISYRRSDAQAQANEIAAALQRRFPYLTIFLDVDRMEGGAHVRSAIDEHIDDAAVVLVLIGPTWLDVADDDGVRRLEQETDFVRYEIVRALERGRHVIPVLLDQTPMPRVDELPEPLKPLLDRHAMRFTMERFGRDMGDLAATLQRAEGFPTGWSVRVAHLARLWFVPMVGLAILGALAAPAYPRATLVRVSLMFEMVVAAYRSAREGLFGMLEMGLVHLGLPAWELTPAGQDVVLAGILLLAGIEGESQRRAKRGVVLDWIAATGAAWNLGPGASPRGLFARGRLDVDRTARSVYHGFVMMAVWPLRLVLLSVAIAAVVLTLMAAWTAVTGTEIGDERRSTLVTWGWLILASVAGRRFWQWGARLYEVPIVRSLYQTFYEIPVLGLSLAWRPILLVLGPPLVVTSLHLLSTGAVDALEHPPPWLDALLEGKAE